MELLKKEIKFRGCRRGMKELDMIIGSFVDECLDDLSQSELEDLRLLLLEIDQDLFYWFNEDKAPAEFDTPVYRKIFARIAHHKE